MILKKDQILSIGDIANICNVHNQTVHKWIKKVQKKKHKLYRTKDNYQFTIDELFLIIEVIFGEITLEQAKTDLENFQSIEIYPLNIHTEFDVIHEPEEVL